MKLDEIHLDGFGRLVNCTFQFASGFNLIFGPNEAGKTTLQRAILSLLYGFLSVGRIKAAERDAAATLHPWDENAAYAGRLTYTLDGGQTLQVSRTFAPCETSLTTYPDARDVSGKFRRESQGRLLFADEQLGMGKEVFENTCYVRQAELVALEESANAITETLMRLAASASTDTTTTDAMGQLEQTLKNEVGTPRAWTKPLPRALKRLSELEDEHVKVLQTRRGLFSQIVELDQSEDKLRELELRRQRLRYLQVVAESRNIRQQLSAANEADAEVSRCAKEMAKWQAWAAFPVGLHNDILRLATQHNHLQREGSRAQKQAAVAREQLRPIGTQMATVEKRVAALADARGVSSEALPQVQQLANQWKMTNESRRSAYERWRKAHSALEEARQRIRSERVQLESATSLGHAGLAELRQQLVTARQRAVRATESLNRTQAEWARVGMAEAEFQQLKRTAEEILSGIRPAPRPRKGCKALLSRQPTESVDQTPTELVIYGQVKQIYEGLIQSRAELEAAQEALDDVEADIIKRLGGLVDSTLDDNMFAQLGQRLENHLRAEANVKQQEVAVNDLKSDLDTAQQGYQEAYTALQKILTGLGFDATDVQVALDSYVKQCERKGQFEREEAELERLQLQAQALERDVNDWQEKQAALEGVETELCGLLTQAGIECPADTLETALAKFDEGVENHNRWAQAKEAYEATIKHQSSLPDAETRARLRSFLEKMETKSDATRAEHPEWSKLEPNETPQEYARLIQQTDDAWASAREECNRLRSLIEQTTNDLRHPAAIDEEISAVKAKIQRLEQFRDALELAQKELTRATEEFQKLFAPKLERLMSEGLSRVTGGRYSDIQVDPKSLSVSLTAPELSRLVGVGRLSTGTRDLVYLMLRIAIARLMSGTQEKLPLLLDDPLVQCDRARQEQSLEFLAQLAKETQVFLFTKDEWTRRWFKEKVRPSSAHSVHILD